MYYLFLVVHNLLMFIVYLFMHSPHYAFYLGKGYYRLSVHKERVRMYIYYYCYYHYCFKCTYFWVNVKSINAGVKFCKELVE